MELRDRFRGCLVGLAVGDALGQPIEGMRAEKIRHIHGIVSDYLPGAGSFEAGEGTDDTHQMLAVAESYVESGRMNVGDIAGRFVKWFSEDGRGIGRTTNEVLSRLDEGMPLDQAALEVCKRLGDNAAGNGSLMRCAPTGLLRFREPEALDAESAAISAITHADQRCIDACILLNRAIAYLINVEESADAEPDGSKKTRESAIAGGAIDDIARAKDARGSTETRPAAPILPVLLSISQSLHPKVHTAIAALTTFKPHNVRTGGYVIETLQAGLWAVIHARNFEEGQIALMTLGGDTDTVGAVGGALLGAKFGIEGIPKRWLDGLKMRDRVIQASDGLLGMLGE
ncbi:ADP-ribosylglycohydrolase family protein [bacterium]|nr:ADP-ribosylglycohydrolase family protein [bacterium]